VIVAGRPHKANALGVFPGQDAMGKYTKRCIKFADEYGWTRAEVCSYWAQTALAIEFAAGRTRPIAEDTAWHVVYASLFKHGEPS
jgi:hypothetical protein